jgi:hypothetical protein
MAVVAKSQFISNVLTLKYLASELDVKILLNACDYLRDSDRLS